MLFSDGLEIWNPGTLTASLSLSQLKKKHGSFPFNPLLAEPMYLSGYIEKLGTGTRDMVNLCVAANLKEPDFTLDDGFRVTIWRPTEQVSGEVSEEIKRVIHALEGEVKRIEIQQILDLKSDDYFRVHYINPALEARFIELTFPDSPNHPQQRYRLSASDKALKRTLKKATKQQ